MKPLLLILTFTACARYTVTPGRPVAVKEIKNKWVVVKPAPSKTDSISIVVIKPN